MGRFPRGKHAVHRTTLDAPLFPRSRALHWYFDTTVSDTDWLTYQQTRHRHYWLQITRCSAVCLSGVFRRTLGTFTTISRLWFNTCPFYARATWMPCSLSGHFREKPFQGSLRLPQHLVARDRIGVRVVSLPDASLSDTHTPIPRNIPRSAAKRTCSPIAAAIIFRHTQSHSFHNVSEIVYVCGDLSHRNVARWIALCVRRSPVNNIRWRSNDEPQSVVVTKQKMPNYNGSQAVHRKWA